MNEPFEQSGDVFLYHTLDGGEVTIKEGLFQMTGGLPTAVYLSVFGGNSDDPGLGDTTLSWWNNLEEQEPAQKYRSETQFLLESLPAIPANLRRIEQAILRDLAWLLEDKIASSINVEVTLVKLNAIKVDCTIEARGIEENFSFVEAWKAGGFEPILEAPVPEWRTLENYYPRLTDDGYIRGVEPE